MRDFGGPFSGSLLQNTSKGEAGRGAVGDKREDFMKGLISTVFLVGLQAQLLIHREYVSKV